MKKNRFKGFDENLCCRGMQFEIGKEYKIDNNGRPPELCTESVFHYSRHLQDVFSYYSPWERSRYCLIEVLGEEIISNDGTKGGSNHIRIVREVSGEELKEAISDYLYKDFWARMSQEDEKYDRYIYENSWNSGNRNTGVFNTGKDNTGDYNIGNRNSGGNNTGSCNSGENNIGMCNAGENNIGMCNAGNDNIGDWNTGFRNFGSFNTGMFNKANGTCGVFCTTDDSEIRLFNKPSGMSLNEIKKTVYWKALTQSDFKLYQDSRCANNADRYKEACALWWENTTEENKAIILSMPNFDADIFEEITGIRVRG